MMKKKLFLFAIAFFTSTPLWSQLVLQGEFRPRFEYRGGYRNMISDNQEDAVFVSQRTRLNLYYSLPRISFGFSMQDVRVWGDETLVSNSGVFGDNSSLDLNEAWMDLRLYKSGTLKIGRQFWSYEDERILSVRNWNQGQIKYDGLLFCHKTDKVQLDLGLSWNNNAENIYGNEYPPDRMKTLNFLSVKLPVSSWAKLTGMVILSGFTRTDTTPDINLQNTYAVYANFQKNSINAIFSGFYQNGLSRAGKKTNAYMFSMKGDYTAGPFTFGAGIDYLSGNNGAKDELSYKEKEHSFDILYGARHKYYGHLDLFSSMQKATASAGLMDLFIKLSWKFVPKASFNTELHHFSLQNNAIDGTYQGTGTQYYAKALGPEADFNLSLDILDFLNLKGGYSVMFPTSTMVSLQGMQVGTAKNPQWVWVMITAKPVFLNTASRDN